MLHLGANMMTFYSFAPRLVEGRSSAAAPRLSAGEFFALWTASGVLSSLASSAFYARIGSFTPSLGASGSLFAVLAYFCLSHPDAGECGAAAAALQPLRARARAPTPPLPLYPPLLQACSFSSSCR